MLRQQVPKRLAGVDRRALAEILTGLVANGVIAFVRMQQVHQPGLRPLPRRQTRARSGQDGSVHQQNR